MNPPTSPSSRRPARRLARWAATGAVLAAGLSGCAGNTATLGDAIPAVGGAPKAEPIITPAVGDCRKLSGDGIAGSNDNTPAGDCSAPHTTLTYLVGKLDDKVKTTDDVRDACSNAWSKALGLSEEKAYLTVFSLAYFMPTSREYALGHRDYRCDLVATNTYDGTPQALPGSKIPLIAGGKYAESYALCRTSNSHNVPCTQPHAWKAAGSVVGPEKFPGLAAVKKLTRARCPKLTSTKQYLTSYHDNADGWAQSGGNVIMCWNQQVKK
jgi:hypothetical protein